MVHSNKVLVGLLASLAFVVAEDYVCPAGQSSTSVSVGAGDAMSFFTNEAGDKYTGNVNCKVTYEMADTCKQLLFDCEEFSLGKGDFLAVSRQTKKGVKTKKFKNKKFKVQKSNGDISVLFKSNKKKNGDGAFCYVECSKAAPGVTTTTSGPGSSSTEPPTTTTSGTPVGQNPGPYQPGTPGAVWSQEEVEIVRAKVREMINRKNWLPGGLFYTDGTLSGEGALSIEPKWCLDCLWNKADVDKGQVPNTAKLIRLSFHDCKPYITEDGQRSGGCDGCLNWSGIGFGYQGMMGMQGILNKTYFPVDKGDNNGLQTVAAALELIYTQPSWPSNVRALNLSLKDSGKSRADLWQFAGIVGLEVEIERANFGCDYDFNTGNQVRLLEGEDKCYFKLFKPSVFKFGRRDCIPDETKKETNFPYEATDTESHSNNYGSAKHVVDSLQTDFGLTAREIIALSATHATAGQHHNFRIPTKYMWPGNPYLTNMYFKYLAGVGMYRRYKGLKPTDPVSIGDWRGGPNMATLWKLNCFKVWKSNMTDSENGWAGPCNWRPTNSGCNRPGEERSKNCFNNFDEDGNIVLKSGNKDKNNLCKNTTFDENRVQIYMDADIRDGNIGEQACGNELTFALTYEVNLMNEFELDEEFKPRGCNGDLEKQWYVEGGHETSSASKLSTINCPPNMEQYENGEALSEITTAFGEDHDVWNRAFLDGWEKMVENGYEANELVEGPEYSWLGYSHFGSFDGASYPIVFTDSKELNPTTTSLRTETFREECLKVLGQELCPPTFKTDHENYYLERLQSPWNCSEQGSLENIEFNIINVKDGKMMQVNEETGSVDVALPSGNDNQKWTYKPSCEDDVIMTNVGTSMIFNWTYDSQKQTLTNNDGLSAVSWKKSFNWEAIKYLADSPSSPWNRFQWNIKRAQQ